MSAQVNIHSRVESPPSSADSDDLQQIIYSSSSHDRSSVGSIPWAEDAIRQNQQEWQRIEQMFYGEEELPENDPELCREINEWVTKFPHIRVIGKQLKTVDCTTIPGGNGDNTKEFSSNLSATQTVSASKTGRVLNESFIIHPEAKSIFLDMDISSLLERDLRINSVPMISKRRHVFELPRTESNEPPPWRHPFVGRRLLLPQKTMSGRVNIRRQIFPWNSSNAIIPTAINSGHRASHPLSNVTRSAKIVRMPPIVNFIMPAPPTHTKYLTSFNPSRSLYTVNANEKWKNSSATKSYERLVLPVLHLTGTELPNRSISAANGDGKFLKALHLSKSATKLKSSK